MKFFKESLILFGLILLYAIIGVAFLVVSGSAFMLAITIMSAIWS